MNFDRDWTNFAVEAEIEQFGETRIVDAHNKLRALAAEQEARIVELEREVEDLKQSNWNAKSDAEKTAAIREACRMA